MDIKARGDIEKLKEMGASVCFSEFHNTVVIVVNGHKFVGEWDNAIFDAYKYFTGEYVISKSVQRRLDIQLKREWK